MLAVGGFWGCSDRTVVLSACGGHFTFPLPVLLLTVHHCQMHFQPYICDVFFCRLQYLEILSGTKLIKPAALNKPSPHREGSPATPKRPEDPSEDSFVQLQTETLGSYGGNREKELLMLKRAQDAEEKWRGAQALIEQIKMTFSEKEKELENTVESLKRQQERELFKLNQENYILQAKLSSFEETSRKQRWLQFGEISDPLTEEKLKQIQKEIQEQETLLQGYQQENERLYSQVKDLQEQNKKNEERMFKENQNLFSELASLK